MVECPKCNKTVTLRCLRWRHVCKTTAYQLTPEQAESRRLTLEEPAYKRFRERNGSPRSVDSPESAIA